jgi:hypothetical protein
MEEVKQLYVIEEKMREMRATRIRGGRLMKG